MITFHVEPVDDLVNETTTCEMCGNTRPINAYCTCPYGDALEQCHRFRERCWMLENDVARLTSGLGKTLMLLYEDRR